MKFQRFSSLFFIIFAFYSCSKTDFDTPASIEVHDFIWKGMNTYYLWQSDVDDLSDVRFFSQPERNQFLQNFSSPLDIFQHLRNEPGVIDKYSYITDDYIALENSRQGINLSNGMEFGLVRYEDNPSNVFGYVRYVVSNSNAASQGVTRGMIFNQVNGTNITDTNYLSLLNQPNYTITLANYNDGNPISTNITISLAKSELQENPIAINTIINNGEHRIGYLLYNQFITSYDDELNAAFAQFRSENITDLVVDLRYNSGGSVRTATYLAAMITGQFTGQLFSRQRWNSKIMNSGDFNFDNNFPNEIDNGLVNEPIQSLNLNRVFFITSGSTASASELVINSLNPYINVTAVGTLTEGKTVGSVTLYDSPNFSRDGVNPNHTWAIQPIVLEIVNQVGVNQPNGISPNIELRENLGNLGVLGNPNEPLLSQAIDYIINGSIFSQNKINYKNSEISNSKMLNPTKDYMYIELE